MALPKVEDVRQLSDTDLSDRVVAVKQALFELRMKRSIRQEVKPHEFKHLKHELSQLLTVEHQRKQSASPAASASEPEPSSAEASATETSASEPSSTDTSSSEE